MTLRDLSRFKAKNLALSVSDNFIDFMLTSLISSIVSSLVDSAFSNSTSCGSEGACLIYMIEPFGVSSGIFMGETSF